MRKISGSLAAFLLFVTLLLSGCEKKPELYRAQFFDLFDTITVIVGYDTSEAAFKARAEKVRADLEVYHKLYDIYHSYDGMVNLRDVNLKAGQGPVKVDPRLIDLLAFSKDMYEKSNGRVNIAMGSVLKIWHDHREAGREDPAKATLPDIDVLKRVAAHTDIRNLVIDRERSTVELKDPDMRLDVGATAKGFATERAARLAEARGEKHLLLSVGGNIRAVGAKDDAGTPWRVGVENPVIEDREKRPNLAVMAIRDQSLVTSGSYERFYTVDGKRYHHIIDPDTLFPENRYLQVSILTHDSGVADGLSTALFNMSREDGEALLRKFPGSEAMWVLPDQSIEKTPGFSRDELPAESH